MPKNQARPKIILQGEELNNLLFQNELLISVSRPIMNKVFDCFVDKTKLLFLCDSRGFIIDLVSSPEIIQWCFNRGIMLGSCLDYYSFGTNSISMAIYGNAPVVIIGDEHYCDVMKTWSCIASPIRVDGKAIGYIDISSGVHDDLVQLTAVVELMAEMIKSKIISVNIKRSEKIFSGEENSQVAVAAEPAVGENHPKGEECHPAGYKNEQPMEKALFFGKAIVESGCALTVKEAEVLYELYTGKKYDEVIKDLNISRNTLKTHLRNILNKFKANNYMECIDKIVNSKL